MIILTLAVGYEQEHVLPFLKSLRGSGYRGAIAAVTDKPGIFEGFKVECFPYESQGYLMYSDRHFAFRKVLAQCPRDQLAMTADVRDVIFQGNPEEVCAAGLSVFCETEMMTLGACPCNSKWLRESFGPDTLEDLKNRSIVCAGVTCGSVPEMAAYTDLMCSTLGGIPSQFAHDQAVHNVLVYKCLAHVRVFANEESPVYTVGYLPRESVQVVDGLIHNKAGKVPAVVHQWDRHNNLVALVKERYG